jgi:hypothetical protein
MATAIAASAAGGAGDASYCCVPPRSPSTRIV